MQTFDIIHRNIGLKVNYDKTKFYRVVSLANSNAKFYTAINFMWTNEHLNVLGVTISNDTEDIKSMNYNEILLKSQTVLHL